MTSGNLILQHCHVVWQQQQHGVGAVEGEVEDCCVNPLVVIRMKFLLHIHHLDWNLKHNYFDMKDL